MMSEFSGKRAAIVSYRLGTADGVSVTAAQWATALHRLGMQVRTVAGDGNPDVRVPDLALDARRPPTRRALAGALDDADVVIADNVCSLPMNQAAGDAVADYLRGRPAVLRHHDLPWERERYAAVTTWPPDDAAWRHVTVNELARRALAARRGIAAATVYHGFSEQPRPQERHAVRSRLEVGDGLLVLQPTRAIPRKNVDVGLEIAEALGATFWLTGPAEDGYADALARLLAGARVPVRRRLPAGVDMAAAYAACDAVVLPSSWEGFGLPLVEAALHRKPIAVGGFPVARELAAFGFRWFPADDPARLGAWLADPDPDLLDHNQRIAESRFGIDALARRLERLLSGAPVCHHAGTAGDDAAGHDGGQRCDCGTA
ncbi:glycosyltransferase involved in cell wall biosynthesis [Pseudonocardia kunmingensis]|uniref:Glycosyltransferase involved in cell wall biosynthesis n=2 Tax=Pseudonocardia kunmingensis TaxID=630975 RepID=A0A543E3D8_9PSEU|nr:glycosyltransferase involved in cell wall biosynthesis [Pseudonocardia kunmingensis]